MARLPGRFNTESHSPAVLAAAAELATPERAPTQLEIANRLMVPVRAIDSTLRNLTRSGRLHPVRLRKVAYRNRPVAEYVPAAAVPDVLTPDGTSSGAGWVDLGNCMALWTR